LERKPLEATENTCILRNEFKIQSGTKKDSSANIYYLTGKINSHFLIVSENILKNDLP
jgi:hypothetical protein